MPRPARTALYTTTAFAVGLIIFAVYQLNSTTVLLAPVKPRMSPAQELVISVISSHKVAVFSKSYCPYCKKAKAALQTLLKPDQYFVMELDQRQDGDAIQDALQEATGGRSVPRVFINNKFIGGGDDTARFAQSGELKEMLVSAGVL